MHFKLCFGIHICTARFTMFQAQCLMHDRYLVIWLAAFMILFDWFSLGLLVVYIDWFNFGSATNHLQILFGSVCGCGVRLGYGMVDTWPGDPTQFCIPFRSICFPSSH